MATIAPSAETQVAGALYRLSPTCETTLDRVEGVQEGRYRRAVLSLPISNGESAPVLTYIKIDDRRGPPRAEYLAHIIAGFQDWGLDLSLLRTAVLAAGGTLAPVDGDTVDGDTVDGEKRTSLRALR